MYVNDDILSRQLSASSLPTGTDIEVISIEINLRKQKWILLGIYHPPNQDSKYFLQELGKMLNFFLSSHENIIILGDFNLEPTNPLLDNFANTFGLYNLVKEPTCFKSDIPTCIDLILTNKKNSFQNTIAVETGLSDFHKLTASNLKTHFIKAEPIKVKYRDYKNFNIEIFNAELSIKLGNLNNAQGPTYKNFSEALSKTLQSHAPLKYKMLRANNAPFMNKTLKKLIMARSKAKNKYYKVRTTQNWRTRKG